MIGPRCALGETVFGPILISPCDWEICSRYSWTACDRSGGLCYAVTTIRVGGRSISIYLHRLLMNPAKGFHVDHVNRNGLDNRRENLRICTASENFQNVVKRTGRNGKSPSSVYKGVWKHSDGKKWQCQYQGPAGRKTLGSFTNEIEAAHAYDNHVRSLGLTFPRVNFPRDGELPAVGRARG
jgi:hypothetical protein